MYTFDYDHLIEEAKRLSGILENLPAEESDDMQCYLNELVSDATIRLENGHHPPGQGAILTKAQQKIKKLWRKADCMAELYYGPSPHFRHNRKNNGQ